MLQKVVPAKDVISDLAKKGAIPPEKHDALRELWLYGQTIWNTVKKRESDIKSLKGRSAPLRKLTRRGQQFLAGLSDAKVSEEVVLGRMNELNFRDPDNPPGSVENKLAYARKEIDAEIAKMEEAMQNIMRTMMFFVENCDEITKIYNPASASAIANQEIARSIIFFWKKELCRAPIINKKDRHFIDFICLFFSELGELYAIGSLEKDLRRWFPEVKSKC